MRIQGPSPVPRDEGDYRIRVGLCYGKPSGTIWLDEENALRLEWVYEDDCKRLISAATEILEQIRLQKAQMAAPHGSRYVYEGRCQLCGKDEEDLAHAELPA